MIKRSWVAALAIPGAAMADDIFLFTIISHYAKLRYITNMSSVKNLPN